MEELSPRLLSALAGFVIGGLFGAVVQRTNFCTMGAVADLLLFGDGRRLRSWLLAIAVALLTTQLAAAVGLLDLSELIYLERQATWFGALVGGLLFGIGMVFAGGCGSRNLVRLGSGDLRSFVTVLVLGVSAAMALHGLTAAPRLMLEGFAAVDLAALGVASSALPDLLAGPGAGAGSGLRWVVVAIAGLGLLALCLANTPFRAARRELLAGLLVGLLVTTGWLATGVLGADDFEPARLRSLTFVAPVGNGLLYLMTFSGSTINFGIAAVFGVVAGGGVSALLKGDFRVQVFQDRSDFLRNLVGAFLMGFGGVAALGCSIGQGITGLSTLSAVSLLAFLAIVAGAALGLRLLERLS